MAQTREEKETEERQREELAGFADRTLRSSLRSTHTTTTNRRVSQQYKTITTSKRRRRQQKPVRKLSIITLTERESS
jgi:hypothetical protein